MELSDLWLKAAHEGAARFDDRFHPLFQPGHLGHRAFEIIGVVPDRGKTLERLFRCRQLRFGVYDHGTQRVQKFTCLVVDGGVALLRPRRCRWQRAPFFAFQSDRLGTVRFSATSTFGEEA